MRKMQTCDKCKGSRRFTYPVFIDFLGTAKNDDTKRWCRECIEKEDSFLQAFITMKKTKNE